MQEDDYKDLMRTAQLHLGRLHLVGIWWPKIYGISHWRVRATNEETLKALWAHLGQLQIGVQLDWGGSCW